MLVYRNNRAPFTDYPIYTIWYENLGWRQFDPETSRLEFSGADHLELTSGSVACTSGKLSIASIYIFNLNGWQRWIGSYQNIFTLRQHSSSSDIEIFSYSLKV